MNGDDRGPQFIGGLGFLSFVFAILSIGWFVLWVT